MASKHEGWQQVSILDVIFDRLKTTRAGSFVAQRVYADVAPQGVQMPYLIVEVDNGEYGRHLGGRDDLNNADITVVCVDNTKVGATHLAGFVQDAMQDWTDTFTDPAVSWCTHKGRLRRETEETDKPNQRMFAFDVNFEISYKQEFNRT